MSKQETKEQLKRTKSKEEYAKLLMDYFRTQEYYKPVSNINRMVAELNRGLI